jgi:hypothetical protein
MNNQDKYQSLLNKLSDLFVCEADEESVFREIERHLESEKNQRISFRKLVCALNSAGTSQSSATVKWPQDTTGRQ